jgi:hypothetical protein
MANLQKLRGTFHDGTFWAWNAPCCVTFWVRVISWWVVPWWVISWWVVSCFSVCILFIIVWGPSKGFPLTLVIPEPGLCGGGGVILATVHGKPLGWVFILNKYQDVILTKFSTTVKATKLFNRTKNGIFPMTLKILWTSWTEDIYVKCCVERSIHRKMEVCFCEASSTKGI